MSSSLEKQEENHFTKCDQKKEHCNTAHRTTHLTKDYPKQTSIHHLQSENLRKK